MIAQHHQYIDPQQYIDNLHFIFIFRDNNPNYVVFLRYFLGSCRFCFHYTKQKFQKLYDKKLLKQTHIQNSDMLFPIYIQSAVN